MPRKRPNTATFAETVAALPAAPAVSEEQREWAAERARNGLPGEAEFVDAQGRRWRLVRAMLDPRSARRLAGRADVLLAGHWLHELEEVPPARRQEFWQSVRKRLYVQEPPGHEAHEYASADGLVLLCVTECC
ncbi:hypothetical protein [Kitasatospora sp. NPDC051914]|uniref:hypothetical protein n=1 Tax=Kitasatospora sp. NPDC051914 TaxID=3154945 RepID=UPI003423D936